MRLTSKFQPVVQAQFKHDPDYWCDIRVKPYNCFSHTSGQSGSRENPIVRNYFINENSTGLLNSKLAKINNRKNRIWIGAGIDPYPLREKSERLTRRLIEVIAKHGYSILLITSSDIILRDIDLINECNQLNHVTVAFRLPLDLRSKTSIVKRNHRVLNVIERFARTGIQTGVVFNPLILSSDHETEFPRRFLDHVSGIGTNFAYLPVIYMCDSPDASDCQIDPVIFYPEKCHTSYAGLDISLLSEDTPFSTWTKKRRAIWLNDSEPDSQFSKIASSFFRNWIELCGEYRLPFRIPPAIMNDHLNENRNLAQQLASLAYLRQVFGKSFRDYFHAAVKLHQMDSDIKNMLRYGTFFSETWIKPNLTEKISQIISGEQNPEIGSKRQTHGLNLDWILA